METSIIAINDTIVSFLKMPETTAWDDFLMTLTPQAETIELT